MKCARSLGLCLCAVLSATSTVLGAHPREDARGRQQRAEAPSEESARRGERFYRLGVGVNGAPVPAIVQGDLTTRSTALPCVNCHRRSGLGSAEGSVTVPPVTGDVVFRPVAVGRTEMGSVRTTGPGTRPAYDHSTLTRALREGVDPAGRSLSGVMPRYDVSDADVTALSAYLRRLSDQLPRGVTDSQIHLATIVAGRVSTGKRASLLDVLRTYVRDKNAGTRNETRRRERGPWDMKQHYESYREWVLHEWELYGSPGEWPAQLADLYGRQPVFAFVSGLADDDWTPIHEFSERFNIPAVLPHTSLPPVVGPGDGFYSLYFSRGLALEAETLAHHLEPSAPTSRIVQVSRCAGPGRTAAAAFARRAGSVAPIRSECVDVSAALTSAAWQAMLQDGAETLVLWLNTADIRSLDTLASGSAALAKVKEIYLSSSLVGDEGGRLPDAIKERALLLHPFVTPDEFEQRTWRALAWLKVNGIEATDRQVAVNTLFAAMLVADALAQPRTLSSREYFIERIEHMAARSPNPSAYPAVSFAPQRRFASSGCYVLKVPRRAGEPFRKVGAWFVPTS